MFLAFDSHFTFKKKHWLRWPDWYCNRLGKNWTGIDVILFKRELGAKSL